MLIKNKVLVIAEAGANHNGSIKMAKKLIDAAKDAGADAVKFQAFKAESIVSKRAPKAEYQKGKTSGRNQFEMLKSMELSQKEIRALIEHAKGAGIQIFYSVFDMDSADIVEKFGVGIFKLGSGELTNIPLIRHVAEKGKLLIMSTGMGTDEEIADAVNAFKEKGSVQLLLMNCSTGYPSLLEDSNLRRAGYLEKKFGVPCGNSDHTEGIVVSVIAAALGIPFIEKHFTLDKNLPGPDHSMSMDPTEMKRLCEAVRIIEKKPVREKALRETINKAGIDMVPEEIEKILGCETRELSEREKGQRVWSRKSIVAARCIEKDSLFTERNLSIKRPEQGIYPKDYEKVIGKRARYFIEEGVPITWDMVE